MELAVNAMRSSELCSHDFNRMVDELCEPNLALYCDVRTQIIKYFMEYMTKHNFLHPPVYMFSSVTDPLNHETYPARISYYGMEKSLIQSLIFHKMVIVSLSPIKRVFWLSPNIRLESSEDGHKYATEFTQMDFEVEGWEQADAIRFVGELLQGMKYHLSFRMKKFDTSLLVNLKREAYDYYCDKIKSYKNFDYEINGIEVCSGGQREYEYERLKARMEELNYPLEYFEPILRLAKGRLLKPSAGAGIGIERLTKAILGIDDISEIYPFKRRPKRDFIL